MSVNNKNIVPVKESFLRELIFEDMRRVPAPPKPTPCAMGAVRNGKISSKCIRELQEAIGSMPLDIPSPELLQEENWPEILNEYNEFFLRQDPMFKMECCQLRLTLANLQALINNPPSDAHELSEHRQTIHFQVRQALKHPVYRKLKQWAFNPLVCFLNRASEILNVFTECRCHKGRAAS